MANVSSNNLTTLYSGSGINVKPTSAYGNANVVSLLNAGTDGGNTITNISATGTITANEFVGNLVGLGNIATVDLDGNVLTYLHGDGTWGPVVGNIDANYAYYAGNVTIGNQPNITAVGTLVDLSVSGNVTAGHLLGEGGNISNIQVGNVSGLGNIAVLNLDGNVSNVLAGNGSWIAAGGGGGTPAGNTTEVQFNNAGAFGASNAFTFNNSTNTLTSTNIVSSNIWAQSSNVQKPTIDIYPECLSVGNLLNANLNSIIINDYGTQSSNAAPSGMAFIKQRGTRTSPAAAFGSDIIGRFNFHTRNANNANPQVARIQIGSINANSAAYANANTVTAPGSFALAIGWNSQNSTFSSNTAGTFHNLSYNPTGGLVNTQYGPGGTLVLTLGAKGPSGSDLTGGGAGGVINVIRHRGYGTGATLMPPTDGDQLGGLYFTGGSNTTASSSAFAYVDANITTGNAVDLLFTTAVNSGSNGSMKLNGDGLSVAGNIYTSGSINMIGGTSASPKNLTIANGGISVSMDNISAAYESFGFRTYQDTTPFINPYVFYRSRGNAIVQAPFQSGDAVKSESYYGYADSGNTYATLGSFRVSVADNDYAGNYSSVINLVTHGPNGQISFDTPNVSTAGIITAGNLKGEGGNISNIQAGHVSGLGNIATINLDGNVSNVLAGNGSWIAAGGGGGGGSSISNGSSNVNIATSSGNVTVSVNGVANVATFSNTAMTVATPIVTPNSIVIGNLAGNTAVSNTRGDTIIGYQAGTGSYSGDPSVAIGYNSGNIGQNQGSVAIGFKSGRTQGDAAVAMGYQAGESQTAYAVAIGLFAGQTSQGGSGIAIGNQAGKSSQGWNGIAIGTNAGQFSQGERSIAIGNGAGTTNQANNSIILNATGSTLDQTTANTFTVKPIRAVTDITGLKQLYYDPSTGEIVFYNI